MNQIRKGVCFQLYLLCGILAISVFAVASCGTGKTPGNWTRRAINVDGDLSDWERIPLTYFEQLETEFAVCNDSDFMYFMVRFENQFRARMIRFGGLSIWIDPKGGSEKVFGLRFNGMPDMEFQPPDRDPEDEERAARREERMRQFMDENPVTLTLIDRNAEVPERTVDIDGADGPAAACDIWRDYVVYEFRVPLAQNTEYDVGFAVATGEDLAVGFEAGSMRTMRQAFGRSDRQFPPDSLRRDSAFGERRDGRRPRERRPRGAWMTIGLATSGRK